MVQRLPQTSGAPALAAASLADSWEVVKLLIEQGVDVKSDASGAALIRDHSCSRCGRDEAGRCTCGSYDVETWPHLCGSGSETREEPKYYSALDCLGKVAGRGDAQEPAQRTHLQRITQHIGAQATPTFWISRSTMAFAAWIQKSAQLEQRLEGLEQLVFRSQSPKGP